MKKLFAVLAFSMLCFGFSAHAIDLKEGVHYEVIDKNAKSTAKPEIKEFFSFYCPHCYTFESLADQIKQEQEANGYKFVKSHVDFLRAASKDIQFMLTKAQAMADMLNVPQVSKSIFDLIHKKRGVFTKEQDVKDMFLANGVDAKTFDNTFNSFPVVAAANKMKQEQDKYAKLGSLTGVPTFIVNGKYKLLTSGFKVKTYGELFTQMKAAAIELSKK